MQFKVPQNIDMQDRILGPLTLFQLLYLLIGFLISYSLLKTSTFLFVLFGIPIIILTLAISFIKINDQPFGRFLVSSVLFAFQPKTRLWHKGGNPPKVTVSQSTQVKQAIVTSKTLDPEKLKQVAQKLDQQ